MKGLDISPYFLEKMVLTMGSTLDNHPSVAKDYTELSHQSSPELDSQTTTKELILSHKMLLDRLIYTFIKGG